MVQDLALVVEMSAAYSHQKPCYDVVIMLTASHLFKVKANENERTTNQNLNHYARVRHPKG